MASKQIYCTTYKLQQAFITDGRKLEKGKEGIVVI